VLIILVGLIALLATGAACWGVGRILLRWSGNELLDDIPPVLLGLVVLGLAALLGCTAYAAGMLVLEIFG
jgi:hypothetical protein